MILLFTHKNMSLKKKELQYLCGFYINLKVECEYYNIKVYFKTLILGGNITINQVIL